MRNTTEFDEIFCRPILDSCDDIEKDTDTETHVNEKMVTENRLKRGLKTKQRKIELERRKKKQK